MHQSSLERHHGRCLSIESDQITIRSENGTIAARIKNAAEVKPGDIVQIESEEAHVLTSNRTPDHTVKWMSRVLDPRRLHGISAREKVEEGIRAFFRSKGFRETRTPLLVPCPGMEPHIRPFQVQLSGSTEEPGFQPTERFLPTSPEFAMKRLLAGGLEKIFQITPAFRAEPKSVTHFPEFTMLEWYRAYAGYESVMQDTEQLLESIANKIFGKPVIFFQGKDISVATPWPRLRVRDLFIQYAGIDLVKNSERDSLACECKRLGLSTHAGENWDDIYFKIWLNIIEPKLPENRAVFVIDYPASQAALSVVFEEQDGSHWARRFETYAGGLELGNAFQELTDPVEQRRRFVEDMELRKHVYGPSFPKNPLDEEFLHALSEGMPPSSGNAMGVDRLVMLFADEPDIRYTTWLEPV